MGKNYYGSMCIAAKLDFYVSNSNKSIEEVQDELLDMGFEIKLFDSDGNEIPKEKLEIVEMEGNIIGESQRGNVKEPYTDDFTIYEDE